jgi:hypothetical protein
MLDDLLFGIEQLSRLLGPVRPPFVSHHHTAGEYAFRKQSEKSLYFSLLTGMAFAGAGYI